MQQHWSLLTLIVNPPFREKQLCTRPTGVFLLCVSPVFTVNCNSTKQHIINHSHMLFLETMLDCITMFALNQNSTNYRFKNKRKFSKKLIFDKIKPGGGNRKPVLSEVLSKNLPGSRNYWKQCFTQLTHTGLKLQPRQHYCEREIPIYPH